MLQTIIADVPPPLGETRNFDYCISLNNLTDYADYWIVAQTSFGSGRHVSPYWVVKPESCVVLAGYRPEVKLVAVPKASVVATDLVEVSRNTIDRLDPIDRNGNNLILSETGIALKSSTIAKTKGIPATEKIYKPASVPLWRDGQKIEARYTITTLTPNTFVIQLAGQGRGWFSIQLIVLPLLGLLLLGMILWNRKHQQARKNKHGNE
jgi:hypothetical protein